MQTWNKTYDLERCSECGKYFAAHDITNFWNGKICNSCCDKYVEKWWNEYILEFVDEHMHNFIFDYYYNTFGLKEIYNLYLDKFNSLPEEEKQRHYNAFCNTNKEYFPFLIRRLKSEE